MAPVDQPLHASGRICSHSKVCSHSSSFNTGCQESLLSKTPLCQNVSSKYIYRLQFPPQLPSVPAASVPRLTYGSKIRTLCACLLWSPGGAREEWIWGLNVCKGPRLCTLWNMLLGEHVVFPQSRSWLTNNPFTGDSSFSGNRLSDSPAYFGNLGEANIGSLISS